MNTPNDPFTPQAIADRLERVADRYDNAGDAKGAKEARDTAAIARSADAATARQLEVAFNLGHAIDTEIPTAVAPEASAPKKEDGGGDGPHDGPGKPIELEIEPGGTGEDGDDVGDIDAMESEARMDLDKDGDIAGVPMAEALGESPDGSAGLPTEVGPGVGAGQEEGTPAPTGAEAERNPSSDDSDADLDAILAELDDDLGNDLDDDDLDDDDLNDFGDDDS